MIKAFDETLMHALDECEKRDGSDSIHELVMCSYHKNETCDYFNKKKCEYPKRCCYQISEREVAESRIAYKEAAQIQ